jgi:phosphohistidine phosphatase SixA
MPLARFRWAGGPLRHCSRSRPPAAGQSPSAYGTAANGLQARQTAEAYWRACNPFATFTAERGLQPSDPPEWFRDKLLGDTRELMAVGHMPNIARVLRVLLGDDPDASRVSFPVHGLVALEAVGDRWLDRWRLGQ